MSLPLHGFGRDGASTLRSAATEDGLRRPSGSCGSFRPLHAGGDIAARCPYLCMVLVGTARPPSAVLLRPSSAVALLRRMERTGCAVRAARVVRSARCTRAGTSQPTYVPTFAMVLVGTARCAVQRRVQRRNGGAWFARLTWFVPPAGTRAGTSQRDVPTFAWFLVKTARCAVRASHVVRSARCTRARTSQRDVPTFAWFLVGTARCTVRAA